MLLSVITNLNATEFEEHTAELLRSMGFIDVKRVGRTADRGVDVEAYQEDAFGFRTKYIVQCKFYNEGLVSSPEMQKFIGAISIHNASRGIFVTSSTFTTEAREIASQNNITLIDSHQLNELIKKYDLESIQKQPKVQFTTKKDSRTYTDIYNSLSFGKRSGEPFVIPNIEPLALIKGLTLTLENIATIDLKDIRISDARIETKGLFGVQWSVDKTWHDSQGRVRNYWRGKGLLITNEQGDVVHDVGDKRTRLEKTPLSKFIFLSEHKNWRELLKKFSVKTQKIKRVAYKRLIKIPGIPSKDIHCVADKYHIATKIIFEYKYRGKTGSIIADCISGDVENNLPIYTKDEIQRLIVREKPELELQEFSTELIDDKWNINSSDAFIQIHKYSGKVMNQKTPAEIIIEETSKKGKKIFKDANYDKNIALKISIGKNCKAHWELSYTSKDGNIFFNSSLTGKYSYEKQINENFALELAQKENRDNSELLEMTREKNGFTFHFLDKKYDWRIFIDIEGNIKLLSQKLTWNEAKSRVSQYLITEGIDSPVIMTSESEKSQEAYELRYNSELDGNFLISISNTPLKYSCDIISQKITDHRAKYIAERASYGEVISIKRRFFGLAHSWNAVIIDESGNKEKIKINGNGAIN